MVFYPPLLLCGIEWVSHSYVHNKSHTCTYGYSWMGTFVSLLSLFSSWKLENASECASVGVRTFTFGNKFRSLPALHMMVGRYQIENPPLSYLISTCTGTIGKWKGRKTLTPIPILSPISSFLIITHFILFPVVCISFIPNIIYSSRCHWKSH